MSNLSTLPKGDSAWLLRKAIERIMQQVSVLETNIGESTSGNSLDGQIIFNDNGTLRGDTGLTYAKSTTTLRAGLLIVPGNTQLATVGTLYVGSLGSPKLKVDVAGTGITTITEATITGDLTVRTNKLAVTSTGVGFGTASPSVAADVVGSSAGAALEVLRLQNSGSGINTKTRLNFYAASTNYGAITGGFGAASPELVFDINTSSGAFIWNNFGSTAMTLNSTGLGVGGSPVSGNKLFVEGSAQIGSSSTAGAIRLAIDGLGTVGNVPTIRFRSAGVTKAYVGLSGAYIGDASTDLLLTTDAAGASVKFGSSDTGTVKMTLDASGNLLVGTTALVLAEKLSVNAGNSTGALVKNTGGATFTPFYVWNATTVGDGYFSLFSTEAAATPRGSISYNRAGGLVAYNTTSDYRSKDIIGPVSNSGSLIDSLKVYFGKMKGATIARPMLIAHEAQEVAPYAVTGTKDEVDSDGKDKYQQMDVSSFVPLLIAEIQSLRTRVQTLEAR